MYTNVYDKKDARNISSQKDLMYLIILKYVAFSALFAKLILLEGTDNNKNF